MQLKELPQQGCHKRIIRLRLARAFVPVSNGCAVWVETLLQPTNLTFDPLVSEVTDVVSCNDRLNVRR